MIDLLIWLGMVAFMVAFCIGFTFAVEKLINWLSWLTVKDIELPPDSPHPTKEDEGFKFAPVTVTVTPPQDEEDSLGSVVSTEKSTQPPSEVDVVIPPAPTANEGNLPFETAPHIS